MDPILRRPQTDILHFAQLYKISYPAQYECVYTPITMLRLIFPMCLVTLLNLWAALSGTKYYYSKLRKPLIAVTSTKRIHGDKLFAVSLEKR